MGENKTIFFVLDIILLLVLIGLIMLVFSFRRYLFVAELFVFAVVVFLAFISLIGVYKRNNWGFILLSIVFAVIMVDLLLIYTVKRDFSDVFVITTILGALGFLVSIAGIRRRRKRVEVVKTFEPGKFIASKTGSTYHAPNCDWAKKIKKKNQVWFDDEKDAKKSYKKHSCLK